jgi:DNA-binding protein H-NS
MVTLEQVQSQIAKLQKQAEELLRKKKASIIADIKALLAKHGLTTADIEASTAAPKTGAKRGPKPGFKRAGKSAAAAPTKKAASQTKGKLPAMYINPKTGETWSGHARPPSWIAKVKNRAKFLITSGADTALAASAGTVSKTKSAAKKASSVAGAVARKGQHKGPQPAKYRDPKTGASWSGRGPAPAWLASAKDRSKFLIDTAGAVASDAVVVSKTKPASKNAVATKAAAKTVKATKVPTAKNAAAKKGVSAAAAALKGEAPKKVAGRRAAPTVKKTAAKKAPATKAVAAKKVVAKADVAATPEAVAAQATA